MQESIVKILIHRDGMTKDEAEELINQAREQMNECIDEGDIEAAYGICEEFFNLEPDYLMELL